MLEGKKGAHNTFLLSVDSVSFSPRLYRGVFFCL